jgi:hypothetical protein
LCGLSTSFRSLECDKRQSRHDLTWAQPTRFSSSKSVEGN